MLLCVTAMIELRKKEKESTTSLLRRFSRKVRQSGVLISARRKMFYHRPKNKRQIRLTAQRRRGLRELRAELIKMGELEPGEKIDLSKIRRK